MKTISRRNSLLTVASVAVMSTIAVFLSTGRVAGAPQNQLGTVVVFDQNQVITASNYSAFPSIDVSSYKQIRIMVWPSSSSCSGIVVNESNVSLNNTVSTGLLEDWFTPCQLDKAYDTPGMLVRVTMHNTSVENETVRVVILGQRY
jgi:hypothetical protein